MFKDAVCGQNIHHFPEWVPAAAKNYISHTENGKSIRKLAKGAGCHASTVLRQVRKIEALRDDPLIDEALQRLGADKVNSANEISREFKDCQPMTQHMRIPPKAMPDDATIEREGKRILRRLSEPSACLAVAKDMEKSVVIRELADGKITRTAVVERPIALAMALKDWISCQNPGRISRYRITGVGRIALKKLLAEDHTARAGFSEGPAYFVDQKFDHSTPGIPVSDTENSGRGRYNYTESPVAAMSRRKDKSGQPFLSAELVSAAERLREDFELSQMGPRITQNWDRFLTGNAPDVSGDNSIGAGPSDARNRVSEALRVLGPGLGDVVLRVCCFMEGLEAAEKRMGWSARSGKIVLRIALQRLKQHYDSNGDGAMIG